MNTTKHFKSIMFVTCVCTTLFFLAVLVIPVTAAETAGNQSYSVKGLYVEGCSCNAPCGCELVGLEKGCEGVGAMSLQSGKYMDQDLSGVKIAYGAVPGGWVRAYIQTSKPEQLDAAKKFATFAMKDMGKIEAIKEAKIDISGSNGKFTVMVDDGKIIKFETEPVLGVDKKTPVSHTNTNNKLNSTFYQAKTISGNFNDGGKSFELKDSNSYFNPEMKSSGQM